MNDEKGQFHQGSKPLLSRVGSASWRLRMSALNVFTQRVNWHDLRPGAERCNRGAWSLRRSRTLGRPLAAAIARDGHVVMGRIRVHLIGAG
jgi:hypothetical protein